VHRHDRPRTNLVVHKRCGLAGADVAAIGACDTAACVPSAFRGGLNPFVIPTITATG
jgi:hypothetical protein